MSPFQLRRAAHLLSAGHIVAHPTEGVFGLACDPDNETAVSHLLALKTRPQDKGLILLAGKQIHLDRFAHLDAQTSKDRERYWPGPVTLILPAHAHTSPLLTGGRNTIACRVTAHPLAAALCTAFGGALVSTSANPGGRHAALNALAVRRDFPTGLAQILGGTLSTPGRPSRIIDLASGATLRD